MQDLFKYITPPFKVDHKKGSWLWWIIPLMIFPVMGTMAADFQDAKPLKTRLSLTCTQMTSGEVQVSARIRARIDKKYVGLPNLELQVYAIGDSTNTLLDKKVSDKDGNVSLVVRKGKELSLNGEGYYGVLVSFEGDDKYKATDKELLFKAATLEMNASEEDSVKTITIQLTETGEESLPIEDVEVTIEVPRMFSHLPIVTESTDEDGKLEVVFPNDLPGGESGLLQIIAKVEDTDEHASLQNQIEKDWGIPVATLEKEKRSLWSPDAPLWMVLTFALLMALVWGHFFVIVYKLYLIRKEGHSISEELN